MPSVCFRRFTKNLGKGDIQFLTYHPFPPRALKLIIFTIRVEKGGLNKRKSRVFLYVKRESETSAFNLLLFFFLQNFEIFQNECSWWGGALKRLSQFVI
jgi:hypothetical protein